MRHTLARADPGRIQDIHAMNRTRIQLTLCALITLLIASLSGSQIPTAPSSSALSSPTPPPLPLYLEHSPPPIAGNTPRRPLAGTGHDERFALIACNQASAPRTLNTSSLDLWLPIKQLSNMLGSRTIRAPPIVHTS
ncbi:MAG: hypothetical protein ACSHX5_11015 [Phycisphaerales bacterium]